MCPVATWLWNDNNLLIRARQPKYVQSFIQHSDLTFWLFRPTSLLREAYLLHASWHVPGGSGVAAEACRGWWVFVKNPNASNLGRFATFSSCSVCSCLLLKPLLCLYGIDMTAVFVAVVLFGVRTCRLVTWSNKDLRLANNMFFWIIFDIHPYFLYYSMCKLSPSYYLYYWLVFNTFNGTMIKVDQHV